MFFNVLERFNTTNKKIDARINELQAELREAEAKLTEARGVYNELLIAEGLGEPVTTTDLNSAKRNIEKLEQQAADLRQRIDLIRAGKASKLSGLVSELKRAYEKRKLELDAEIREQEARELRKLKADYLLALARLTERHSEAHRMKDLFNRAAAAAGIKQDVYYAPPTHNLFSTYSGTDKPLAPTQREIEDAISGKLPLWVRYYKATGELGYDSDVPRDWEAK